MTEGRPDAAARVVAIVQARASSSRLPGKVLKPLGPRTVLEWVLRAALSARQVDAVVLATSADTSDDAVADLGGRLAGVRVHRGELDDVLSRFVGAVEGDTAQAVVRLTADCPLLDPSVVDLAVGIWRSAPHIDYVSTTNPRCLPRGLDVEVVARSALLDVAAHASGPDRVHVTSGIYRDPTRYSVMGVTLFPDASDLRVTLDTPEDESLLARLVDLLGDRPPSWRDVVAVLRSHPELLTLNAHVRQKEWHEG